MRSILILLGVSALSASALAADGTDSRAEELARLRREVETLSGDVSLAKEDLRGRLKAIDAQKTEIEVQIRREELRLAQAEGEMAARRAELAAHATRTDTLGPAVRAASKLLRAVVAAGLPFHQPERLEELDKVNRQLDAGELGPEAAVARLWAFTEDELRLSRENGLDRQVVQVDGADVLADVARLGMAGLFFRTDGGRAGVVMREPTGWRWRELTDRDEKLSVAGLFEKLRHGVRSGGFLLPNPYADGAR